MTSPITSYLYIYFRTASFDSGGGGGGNSAVSAERREEEEKGRAANAVMTTKPGENGTGLEVARPMVCEHEEGSSSTPTTPAKPAFSR